MCRNSFTVGFSLNGKMYVIYGVTSIFPNLNGVLFQTENRKGYQVESYEMQEDLIGNMYIEYSTDEYYEDYEFRKKSDPDRYVILDMRES